MSIQSFRIAFFPAFALTLAVCSTIHAQNSTIPETQQNPTQRETSNSGVYTGREVYVPQTPEKQEPEETARTFADGFLRNTRRHIGFSVGASDFYAPDALTLSDGRKATSFVSLQPDMYLNLNKRKLNARLTYGVTYKGYNKGLSNLNTLTQNGNASLGYNLLSGRKATLNLSDSVSTVYYDSGTMLESYLPTRYQIDVIPQIYVDRRRQTRNTASVDFNYTLTRRASLYTTLVHDILRYGSDVPARSLLTGGVGASYQVNKWFRLDTRYTQYLSAVTLGQAGSNVQNLQFGGMSFNLGRGWVVSTWGGMESTQFNANRWVTGSSQATVSKRAGRTTVELGYHNGYSIVSIGSQVWRGHTASAYLVQKLFRQVGLHANASYFRGSTLLRTSLADTIYGGAGADVAVQKNFVVSTSFSVISQRLVNVSAAGPNLYRYTAMVGLHYYLPSVR